MVGGLTSNKQFDFDADPEQETDPGNFLRNLYRYGIGAILTSFAEYAALEEV